MKLKILLLSLLFLFSLPSFGQSFKAGLTAGLVASQVDGDNFGGYDKIGPYGGLMVAYPINDNLDIAMQISFIQKGSRKNAKPSEGDYDSYLMRLNYAEIPLYMHLNIAKERLYFEGGLTFAYLINAVEKDAYGVIQQATSVPDFRRFEMGILGGFVWMLNEKYSVGIRGQYSLIPIRQTPIIKLWYYNDPLQNNVLVTYLSYYF